MKLKKYLSGSKLLKLKKPNFNQRDHLVKILKFYSSVFGMFFMSSCFCSGGKNRTDSQWVNDMAQQVNVKAQEGTEQGSSYMKAPPEGAIARNRRYYPYSRDPLKAAQELQNPLEPTTEVLSQGAKYYKMYCVYCHGLKGDAGTGASVASKMFIKPASLLTKKAKDYKDGRIYHIIYEGQGLMGAYNIQLESSEQVLLSHYSKDRSFNEYKGSNSIWSVVHYVRQLQKANQKANQKASQEARQKASQEASEAKNKNIQANPAGSQTNAGKSGGSD